MTLTPGELKAISVGARVASSFSFVCNLFTIATFLTIPAFNEPINRLIFFGSWANLIGATGTFIARWGPDAGPNSRLCQAQGFLTQWGPPSDIYWILAMAVNVYLVFFRRYTTEKLRRLEPYYIAICYGIPLVPSIAYLFIRNEKQGRVYGDAITWCFVSSEWSWLRFATEYGPVWLFSTIITGIYVAIGIKLTKTRKRIRKLQQRHGTEWRQHEITVTQEVTIELSSQKSSASVMGESPSGVSESDTNTNMKGSQTRVSKINPTTPAAAVPEDDLATHAYLRFACLYFVALIVTWTAPSINRTIAIVNENIEFYPLYLLHGISLSLQGFWNTIIYIVASLPACKALWRDTKAQAANVVNRAAKWRPRRPAGLAPRRIQVQSPMPYARRWSSDKHSESEKQLVNIPASSAT